MHQIKGFTFKREPDNAVTIQNDYLDRSLTLSAEEWDTAVVAMDAETFAPPVAEVAAPEAAPVSE